MCVYVCIYIYIYIYVYVCVYVCVYICMCIYVYVHIYIYIYIYVYVYVYVTYKIHRDRQQGKTRVKNCSVFKRFRNLMECLGFNQYNKPMEFLLYK